MSKAKLQSLIMQGRVAVGERVLIKAGTRVRSDSPVRVDDTDQHFVCRGAHKLEAALHFFGVSAENKAALDSGLSTGGFTQALLYHNARSVTGVDCGHSQVHERIARNPRVRVMERTNLRRLSPEHLSEPIQLATLDLSFISVLKALPAVCGVLDPKRHADLVVLVKPQFEARRDQVGSGGVVRDSAVRSEVLERVGRAAEHDFGLEWRASMESPLVGGTKSNTELFAHFVRHPP